MYKIKGKIKGKNYISRKKFMTKDNAMKYAYKNLVYNPSGNTKRKNQLTNISTIKCK